MPLQTSLLETCVLTLVSASSTDEALVQACLEGNQRAWTLLIGRYKSLILSFPRRYGARPQDAADIFQFVCAELFVALPQLRKPQSLRSWIMTVASHEAHHWKRRHLLRVLREADEEELVEVGDTLSMTQSAVLELAERDQLVREAVAQLPARSQELLRLLFFEDPPIPYAVVAARLGLSNGSVASIRARSLKKLRRILQSGNAATAQES